MKETTLHTGAVRLRDNWDSAALLAICLLDMLTTLYWVHTHQAVEANPVMAYFLHRGDAAFCVAKLACVVPFVVLATCYRRRRPRLIAIALRTTLILFIGIYIGCIAAQANLL